MAPIVSLAELQDAADRAAGFIPGDGQVRIVWARRASADGIGVHLQVTFTVVRDRRVGEATAHALDDQALRRAAKAAWLRARQARAVPAPPLPAPAPAQSHDGFDPAVLTFAGEHVRREGVEVITRAHATRVAVASTTGVQAAEQRTYVLLRVCGAADGRRIETRRVGVGPIDPAAAVAEAHELLDAGSSRAAAPGEPTVVLGHEAVAWVLDRLRPAFGVDVALGSGPLAGRRGSKVAAADVNLSDSARHPGTLPRSFDAEGVPRSPVPLIQDGVAHRAVLDSAAGARLGEPSTGHATRPLVLAPYPENLVLAGGRAEDMAALAGPVADGIYIPALARGADGRWITRGARCVEHGRLAAGIADTPVEVDPLGVLAATEALTAARRLVALAGQDPGSVGAATVPALRTSRGLRVMA